MENEGGGTTVVLVAGDDLNEVAGSHRRLITAALREAFADPSGYFGRLATRCPFRQMSRWLRALASGGQWELHLNQGYPEEWTLAGFDWRSDMVRGATIGLPDAPELGGYPE